MTDTTAAPPGNVCDGYVPIEKYALIGNCRTAALVSLDGSIDWYCAERFDAPAVFCRVLDAPKGGYFGVRPVGNFTARRNYMDETNVLETHHRSADAEVRVVDFMPMSLVDGDPTESAVPGERRIMRQVEAMRGNVAVEVRFKPTGEYGAERPRYEDLPEKGVVAQCGDLWLGLAAPRIARSSVEDETWVAQIELREGEQVVLLLSHGAERAAVVQSLDNKSDRDHLAVTCRYWREWVQRCSYHGKYRSEVLRSVLALKLLGYDPSGAMVAAPTTSLPEELGGERNWDYRFTWLRDSSLILYAMLTVGYDREARQFLGWLGRTLRGDKSRNPQIMYTIEGEAKLPEKILDDLQGYCNSRPVRVGNAASQQLQLDIYGEVLASAYIDFHHPDEKSQDAMPGVGAALSEDVWRLLKALVEDAIERWKEPDNGIWEVRGGPQPFLYSKLMCWVAVDRGIRIAEEHGLEADLPHWKTVRDEIRKTIEEQGYNEKVGAFVQALGGDVLDAAALAIPRVGFLPATDRRVLSTIEQIQQKLTRDGLVYRYRAADGLPGGEGAFLMCSFWLVDALALAGRLDEATALFEQLLDFGNDVGLYSEEIDPKSHAFLGNFPQGFTHLSLVQAAVDLAKINRHGPEHRPETEAERARRAHHAAKQGSPG